MFKSIVYFTKNISLEKFIKLLDKLGIILYGKVSIKLHSGEDGNKNYVKPYFIKPIIDYVNGTAVEFNTAYDGKFISRL